MWSDAMFEDFKRIVELLENDGWLFVTPYEFYRIKRGELAFTASTAADPANATYLYELSRK